MNRKKLIQLFILLLWLMVSVSCLSRGEDEISVNNSNTVEEILSPEPIATHLPVTPSVTMRPTETLSPSKTPTSESTVIIQPTITPTTMPTLTPGEKDALVLDLFMTNAGCELPCWWGFMPGETEWAQARSFLQTFADRINESPGSPTLQGLDVYISPSVNEESNPLRHFYLVRDGIIELIDVNIPKDILMYQLSNVLNTYGKPSVIFLRTGNQIWFGSLPFSVNLYYPQYSLLFNYSGGGATVEENNVHICFKDANIGLAVWSPEKDLNYTEAAEATLSMRPSQYDLPLEEATGMTVTSFYETFKNSENEACLETPAELWPNP